MTRITLAAVLVAISVTSVARADDGPDSDAAAARHAALRAALEKARATNLARFHRYRKAGVYPHNTYVAGRANVWTDEEGHLCAVATLIHEGGQDDLVTTTAKQQNFVRIADLTSGPLVDWALTSGLTQEELVMIQAPTEADMEAYEAEQRREERKLARARRREDARLAEGYATTERDLRTEPMARAGLDLAVTRLEQHPELAAALLARQ